tara:strand:+ start:4829 stop:5683 length:855 start_codon:yes stop_codon:yes gene_type:complete
MKESLIGVVGSGTMGNGIAHIIALSDIKVVLIDINQEILKKALLNIKRNLNKQLSKKKITNKQFDSAMNNIKLSTKMEDLRLVDLVVEAIPEKYDLKVNLFKKLDSICKESTILATNTSSISISNLASKTKRPERVIGMHFMNPVPVMKLVEVINTIHTSKETTKKIIDLSHTINKVPIQCNDYPGFVSNRILMPMINEAIFCLDQNVATKESIDEIMRLGMSHPMGPLRLADLIGLDVCLDIMKVLYTGFNDSKYRPCVLLEKMVSSGFLGKKTGKGFYNYEL